MNNVFRELMGMSYLPFVRSANGISIGVQYNSMNYCGKASYEFVRTLLVINDFLEPTIPKCRSDC